MTRLLSVASVLIWHWRCSAKVPKLSDIWLRN